MITELVSPPETDCPITPLKQIPAVASKFRTDGRDGFRFITMIPLADSTVPCGLGAACLSGRRFSFREMALGREAKPDSAYKTRGVHSFWREVHEFPRYRAEVTGVNDNAGEGA